MSGSDKRVNSENTRKDFRVKNSMWKMKLFVLAATTVLAGVLGQAADLEPGQVRRYGALDCSKAEHDERMAWWREARFGLMVHWGPYSMAGGWWNEEWANAEWLMHTFQIPVKEYEEYAAKFNPVKFDAKEWVRIAKNAGMRYIVITAKHCDGFAMWRSKSNRYNIYDFTPFQRDPLKELADECAKQGVRLCFYYAHAFDWHHPHSMGNFWNYDESKKDFRIFFEQKCKPQVTELLTEYGPVGLMWFDTPYAMTREQSLELVSLVRRLQGGCIINGRVWYPVGGTYGDGTPADYTDQHGDYRVADDREVPAVGVAEDWETPCTLNGYFGYVKTDKNWKSPKELVRTLVEIVSKGGNYLLNVGPTGEGEIPAGSVESLAGMGRWMEKNGASIYGTTASPFAKLEWGRCTSKPGRLYLHVFDWPADGKLVVPGLMSKVLKAYLLADKSQRALTVRSPADQDMVVEAPKCAPDDIDSVVVLEIEGKPEVAPWGIRQQADGTVMLAACDATVHGPFDAATGQQPATAKYLDSDDYQAIAHWTHLEDYVTWEFKLSEPGSFEVQATFACHDGHGGSTYTIAVGDEKLTACDRDTGTWTSWQTDTVGTVSLPHAGKYTLTIKPLHFTKASMMNLKAIRLAPKK